MTMLAPKLLNSVVSRRLASICRLSNAAVMAAPAVSANRMTNSRPRLPVSSRRTMRQNIVRFRTGEGEALDMAIRLAELALAENAQPAEVESRCPASLRQLPGRG